MPSTDEQAAKINALRYEKLDHQPYKTVLSRIFVKHVVKQSQLVSLEKEKESMIVSQIETYAANAALGVIPMIIPAIASEEPNATAYSPTVGATT